MSIYTFLRDELEESDFITLYSSSPWSVLSVFQTLSPPSKHIIMRLLPLRRPVTRSFIEELLSPKFRSKREDVDKIFHELEKLRLLGRPDVAVMTLTPTGESNETNSLVLNTYFQRSLVAAMTSTDDVPWQSILKRMKPRKNKPSIQVIEQYAITCWNSILQFLLGTKGKVNLDREVFVLMVSTGLLTPFADQASGFSIGNAAGVIVIQDDDENEKKKTTQTGLASERLLTYEQILSLSNSEVHITKAGYEFLLRNKSDQLWTFLREYLRKAALHGLRTADILSLLFDLGFCKLGEGYPVAGLSKEQKQLLDDFASFGLVYIPPDTEDSDEPTGAVPVSEYMKQEEGHMGGPKSSTVAMETSEELDNRLFYPSSLAMYITQQNEELTMLAEETDTFVASEQVQPTQETADEEIPAHVVRLTSAAATKQIVGAKLELLVEKNFKVYAFTSLTMYIALISLIARVEVCLPNLVVATITRKSISDALDKGIGARLIISFLENHLHPDVKSRFPFIPKNVADQITFWEKERQRVALREGVLFSGFLSPDTFNTACAYAYNLGKFKLDSSVAAFSRPILSNNMVDITMEPVHNTNDSLLFVDRVNSQFVVSHKHAEAVKAYVRNQHIIVGQDRGSRMVF